VQRSSRYLNRWNLQGQELAFPTAVPAESERPILIVEDDDDSRAYLETVLQIEGYRVATAANGEEALAVARQEHPRLILLDLMMPQMDGFAFRAAQLRDPTLAKIPVILTSAVEDDAAIARLGLLGEVRKPIDVDTLLEQVALYCERVRPPGDHDPGR
jgi:CheY-like chemotaxis protein